jgi:hypothetical protein
MRSIRLGALLIDPSHGNPADPESLHTTKLTR